MARLVIDFPPGSVRIWQIHDAARLCAMSSGIAFREAVAFTISSKSQRPGKQKGSLENLAKGSKMDDRGSRHRACMSGADMPPRGTDGPGFAKSVLDICCGNNLVNDDYAYGRRDGLRLALTALAAEEEKWAALLGGSRSWRTNANRQVRHKTLQVAQKRIQTILSRFTPRKDGSIDAELAAAIEKAGL